MPDIFGNAPQDYGHIEAATEGDNGRVQTYVQNNATSTNRTPHNFESLGRPWVQNNDPDTVGYLTDNLEAIQAMIEEILYTDFRLDMYIPIKRNVPEGANSYSYRVVDRVGRGNFIDRQGTEARAATVGVTNVAVPLYLGAAEGTWTREDLRTAMFGGVALDSETITAATTGCMDHIELVGISGDATRNLKGLLDQTAGAVNTANAVPRYAATKDSTATAFSGQTGAEIVANLNSAVTKLIENSKEVFGNQIRRGLSIYVPIQIGNIITTTRMDSGTDTTVWDYFRRNNMWMYYANEEPTLHMLQEAKDAGSTTDTADGLTGGTGLTPATNERVVIALNNDRVMELAMPIAPRVFSIESRGHNIMANMEYKISGLNVKRPKGLVYVDGV